MVMLSGQERESGVEGLGDSNGGCGLRGPCGVCWAQACVSAGKGKPYWGVEA